MADIRVWTKQHENVAALLCDNGRYTAKREYIVLDLQEHAPLVLEVYDWLVKYHPKSALKPEDAGYPIWVSYTNEAAMMPGPGTVILELTIDSQLLTPVNIAKWGTILNYSYIPDGEADAGRHLQLLKDYGVSDAKAYMSRFYPQIKREIVSSWDRLFDDRINVCNDYSYGTLWEIKKEWITDIKR